MYSVIGHHMNLRNVPDGLVIFVFCFCFTLLCFNIFSEEPVSVIIDPSITTKDPSRHSTPTKHESDQFPKEFRLKTAFIVDNRVPNNVTKYWTQPAALGARYCEKHHCTFKYILPKCQRVEIKKDNKGKATCPGYKNISAPPAWMKVKGILHVLNELEYGEVALYIDSDVALKPETSVQQFIDRDLLDYPHFGQNGKGVFGQNGKAIALQHDWRSWWTGYHKKTYIVPINTGMILFMKTRLSEVVLQEWWKSIQLNSSLDRRWPELKNETKNHAMSWPWEQDRMSRMFFYLIKQMQLRVILCAFLFYEQIL